MTDADAVSNPLRSFAQAAHVFAELVRAIPDDRWTGPGLGEWDLRALVGHTSRSLITVETYLNQPAETEDVRTPEAYYLAIANVDRAAWEKDRSGFERAAWVTSPLFPPAERSARSPSPSSY